jgi:hypothetical protein
LYQVDGIFHPRKDVQIVKGVVIKPPPKTKAQKQATDKLNKVGKAQNHPAVKDLVGSRSMQATEQDIDTPLTTRQSKQAINYATFSKSGKK